MVRAETGRGRKLSAAVVAGLLGSVLACLPSTGLAAPVEGTGTWTLYYVKEVKGTVSSTGGVRVRTLDGRVVRVRLSPSEMRKANIEGTAAGTDESGERIVSNFIRMGFWEDLPKGWEGKGNRSNPLTTYRSVASDQRHHPFGSRIFVEELVGEEIPGWSKPHDGFLWVADVGGGIKGRLRFDLFVGKQETYEWVMDLGNQQGKWKIPVEVEHLPKAPAGFSPKTRDGRRKILEGLGLLGGGKGAGSAEEALTEFQRRHPHIPAVEYGSARGAVTLWYLTQAALKLGAGEEYDPAAAGSRRATATP